MRLALGFLLPCLCYLALYLVTLRRPLIPRVSPGFIFAAASFLIALTSATVVLITLVWAPHWPGNTQLVWSGVEAIGESLAVGGPREQAVVGWPNESFSPALKASTSGDASASLTIAGGDAFIFDRKKGIFLNGVAVPDGREAKAGDFTLKVNRSYYFWNQVEISGDDGKPWAAFSLPAALIRRERVYPMAVLTGEYADESIRPDAAKMLKLERWAAPLRLLVTREGELRVLGPEEQQAQCELPCDLTLYWPHRVLPIKLTRDNAKLRMDFLPPRRLASPLLPAAEGTWEPLTVTGNPAPGDRAFYLPLGGGIADLRQRLNFKNNAEGRPVFDMQTATVYGEGVIPQLPPTVQLKRPEDAPPEKNITSSVALHSLPYSFYFMTVNDLPDYRLVAYLLLFALVCYGVGLWVAYKRMPDEVTRWVIYGVTAVVWNLLAIRLLLAFRYALAPSSLDALAVKGVTTAFVGLTVVPGVILLLARLRRDLFARPADWPDRKKILLVITFQLLLLVIFGWVAYVKAPEVWANSPSRMSGAADIIWWVLGLLVVLYILLMVFILYKIGSSPSAAQRRAASFFSKPLFPLDWAVRLGGRVWGRGYNTNPWRWGTWFKFLLGGVVVALVFAGVVPYFIHKLTNVVSKVVSADTFVHDIVVPLLFYWPLALLLMASKLVFPPEKSLTPIKRFFGSVALRRVMLRVFLIVFFTVGACVFLLPVAIGDAGSVMGVLSVMVPTATIMMASSPRRWGGVVVLTLTLCFVLAAAVFINVRSVSPYLPAVAASRILVFKEYDILQRYIPFETQGRLQKLRDGYQHTWENKAMAHEGRYTGLGFGNAPARRSQVRQDTIQYDSVFSFFITGDYGLLGGAGLLLLYAVPLALVLVGGRLRFDFGYAVAAAVASSFLLEALIHAGMNLNLFPFTGRDLPLLTANSFTDLLRWTVLFCVAVQVTLYRYKGRRAFNAEADSLISPNQRNAPAPAPAAAPPATGEPLNKYIPAAALLGLVPAIVFIALLWAGWRIIGDKQLDVPFSWSGILEVVDTMAKQGLLRVRPDKTLEFDKSIEVAPGMLIDEEVARFNALPEDERLGESSLTKYRDRLLKMTGRREYDEIINELRTDSHAAQRPERISLFKLLPPLKWEDGMQVKEVGGYRVAANRAFNSQLSFKTGFVEDDFPRAELSGGKVLIGPAWVMGRWVQVYNPSASVPWTAHLMGALRAEWDDMKKERASSLYGKLSLDAELQEAAAEFAGEKGRALHEQLLKLPAEHGLEDNMPPRVALAVVSLPTGEVRAMGGWPRMTSSRFWKRLGNEEWVPPYEWVENEAPQPLRTLYGGDRNFDLMVMGSSTKPLWAAAALKVHPKLNQQLMTRGGDDMESDVFGIKLPSPGWHVGAREWVGFREYLSKSDNRYQVRLGFLGLAEETGGDVKGAGSSGSEKESLRGQPPSPWRMFPKFPPEINFSNQQVGQMRRLEETPFLKHMFNMYSVGINHDYFDRRLSFWTKNQADDLMLKVGEERDADVFKAISPVAPNLDLSELSPRDYVTLLLGGGTNMWSNVDFASAFGTCVTGYAVSAHVVDNQEAVKFLEGREEFPDTAKIVREGLAAVVAEGTANQPTLRAALVAFPRPIYSVYAKTGTLAAQEDERATSRITLAIVKWENESQGKVKSGLVFSIVGERAGVKTATLWLGEFISRNRTQIERLLSK